MQNLIFCKINMFDAKQTVLKVEPDGHTVMANVDLENLGHTIASICNEEQIFNVRLGGNPAFTENIADDIRVANTFNYHSNHEINIEVEVEGE